MLFGLHVLDLAPDAMAIQDAHDFWVKLSRAGAFDALAQPLGSLSYAIFLAARV
jgi:hypothetical protein